MKYIIPFFYNSLFLTLLVIAHLTSAGEKLEYDIKITLDQKCSKEDFTPAQQVYCQAFGLFPISAPPSPEESGFWQLRSMTCPSDNNNPRNIYSYDMLPISYNKSCRVFLMNRFDFDSLKTIGIYCLFCNSMHSDGKCCNKNIRNDGQDSSYVSYIPFPNVIPQSAVDQLEKDAIVHETGKSIFRISLQDASNVITEQDSPTIQTTIPFTQESTTNADGVKPQSQISSLKAVFLYGVLPLGVLATIIWCWKNNVHINLFQQLTSLATNK